MKDFSAQHVAEIVWVRGFWTSVTLCAGNLENKLKLSCVSWIYLPEHVLCQGAACLMARVPLISTWDVDPTFRHAVKFLGKNHYYEHKVGIFFCLKPFLLLTSHNSDLLSNLGEQQDFDSVCIGVNLEELWLVHTFLLMEPAAIWLISTDIQWWELGSRYRRTVLWHSKGTSLKWDNTWGTWH